MVGLRFRLDSLGFNSHCMKRDLYILKANAIAKLIQFAEHMIINAVGASLRLR